MDIFVDGLSVDRAAVQYVNLPSTRPFADQLNTPFDRLGQLGSPVGLRTGSGLGAGFVPEVLDTDLIDDIITVTDLAAERMTKRLAREEGLLLGPSAGANVHAALEFGRRLKPGQRVVTILCDGGERYLC